MTHQAVSPQGGEPGDDAADPLAGDAAEEQAAQEQTDEAGGPGFGTLARELGVVLLGALVLSLLIKTFLIQAFFIPSGSMMDTLVEDDRVIVSKLTPGPIDLRRGDIVVFKDPAHWLRAQPQPERNAAQKAVVSTLTFVGLLPSDSGEHLIKRVIGLPGDTVVCCDDHGRLTVNGAPIDETEYLKPGAQPSGTPFRVVVPPGRLWVMGDNRQGSEDSRAHRDDGHDGTVPVENVVGRAFVLVWPAERFRWLTNPSAVFEDVPATP